MAWAFPEVDPGVRPLGSRILVQIRTPAKKRKSGLYLSDDARDNEKWNTQVAKVIEVGPLAYRNRTTMEPWPEGAWTKAGDFVRIPRHGGDRWEVRIPGREEPALFVVFNDHEIITLITGDPLAACGATQVYI